MQFINNWSRPVTLAPGVTSLALDLPDGDYRLTLADSLTAATRWEIVDAQVSSGAASLVRALEQTQDQDWPAGSVAYCTVTAGSMAYIFARLAALVGGKNSGAISLAAGQGEGFVGFSLDAGYGSVSPATLSLANVDWPIRYMDWSVENGFYLEFGSVNGSFEGLAGASLSVTGDLGTFTVPLEPNTEIIWGSATLPNANTVVAGQAYRLWIELVPAA